MMITVRVRPGAKEDALVAEGAFYRASVKAPPQDNEANEALIRLVARHFQVPQSQVTIRRGARGRTKVVEIHA